MNLKLGSLYVLPLFALQIAGSGCNRANPQAAGPQLPPPPLVSVVRAEAQDVPVYLDEIGKSFASESVTVTPQVGGRIMQREFQDGADLAKGQLLFVIDARPYQAQLDSAKGALAQAKRRSHSPKWSSRAPRNYWHPRSPPNRITTVKKAPWRSIRRRWNRRRRPSKPLNSTWNIAISTRRSKAGLARDWSILETLCRPTRPDCC